MGGYARGLGLGIVSVAIAGSAGCGVATFGCAQDEQCAGVGPAPRCEPSGYCSFEDSECEGGRRYGDAAPAPLSKGCVPIEPAGTTGGELAASSTAADPTISTLGTSSGSSSSSESSTSSGSGEGTTTSGALEPSCTDWWDCEWRSRVRLTIQAPTEEELAQVPVPVRLSWLAEPDDALRFVSPSGEILAHEVDQGLAWVSIPSLPGGSVLEVFAYYDNPSAEVSADPSAVWAEPFALVVHGDDFEDASGNHLSSGSEGPGHTPAVFGDGLLFDGVDDAVVFGPDAASADLREDGLTLTGWIRLNAVQGADYPRIIDHTEEANSQTGWTLAVNPTNADAPQLRVDLGLDVAESRQTFGPPMPAEWFFLAVTVTPDDVAQARFDDLVTELVPAGGEGVALSDAENFLSLGRSSHTDERWFAGEIDEVRLVRGVRSAAWLETEFQLATGELVIASKPELAPTVSR